MRGDSAPRWRISKACQECRRRKIRCDGGEPCQHCRQRQTECLYRGFVRQRRRKRDLVASKASTTPEQREDDGIGDDEGSVGSTTAGEQTLAVHGPAVRNRILQHSVTATHEASPSCVVQLYYGPSSNFSLMQLMYRQLVGADQAAGRSTTEQGQEVEEVGPGLDLFSHRRLFFGDLAGNQNVPGVNLNSPLLFIDPSFARQCLERYLSTFYHMTPFVTKDEYRARLNRIFSDSDDLSMDSPNATILLLILAMGAAMLEEEERAEFLFRKAKANYAGFDELVNVQAVQIPLLMAHYQSERARPNSAFLNLGTAVRKAVAAGLHKNTQLHGEQSKDDAAEKIATFWSLYFYECWICFGLGRPVSLSASEICTPDPTEQPFLSALAEFARIINKAAQNIYGKRHDSLLPMWKCAREIRSDLQTFARRIAGVMKFGLDSSAKSGEVGICQCILMTLYHYILLLTFRPFLVFRARWRQELKREPGSEQTAPSWLEEACRYCLDAAHSLVRYLYEAYQVNDLTKDIKYHGFFLEGACFTIAFHMMHNRDTAAQHLQTVRSGLWCLAQMIPRRQYLHAQQSTTMQTIEQMMNAIFPEMAKAEADVHDFSDRFSTESGVSGYPAVHPQQHQQHPHQFPFPASHPTPDTSTFLHSLGQNLMAPVPDTVASGDTSSESKAEDMIDFPPMHMGWNFDFSSMDLEAFLSIDPNHPARSAAYG
ncbi:hypothetical protein VTN49DRAFT_2430 [Thermomyces lanuginosus]|uniref:uncharacterized protein n=1 Tax=Thermomyces lanuginosus TaxID=5541 RepID=UPI003742A5E1